MKKMTGTAIPLSALRTQNSLGCGEYPDLLQFADFCKKTKLQIIQLLPINDTGTSSSPYNALTAFALHPLYISIKDLPETKNDVSYNLSLLHIMDIVNQANSDLAKVKIVQKINGDESVLERNTNGDKTFTDAEMKGVKEKIDSKKVDERGLGL